MTPSDPLPRMFAHMDWANGRILAVLRAMPEPPPQALDLFAHMLTAEHVWLRRLQGTPATYAVWQSLGLDECERLARANHEGYQTLLASDDRARIVDYHMSNGTAQSTMLADILVHVSHHGMYHRGQVSLLVRASGGTPVSTDYILFVRELH